MQPPSYKSDNWGRKRYTSNLQKNTDVRQPSYKYLGHITLIRSLNNLPAEQNS